MEVVELKLSEIWRHSQVVVRKAERREVLVVKALRLSRPEQTGHGH
jgi:hypothetical protein